MGRWYRGLTVMMGLALSGCGNETDNAVGATARYYEDVAPLIYENCLPCHESGGIAPVPLTSYEETKQAAWLVVEQTQQGLMPPWPPGDAADCTPLKHSRALSEAQIDVFAVWYQAGMPAGDPAVAPALPEPPAGLAEVSTTLDIGAAYLSDAAVVDDYRCFIVDPGLTADAFVTAHEVKAGDKRVVHHVILYSLDGDEAEEKAAQHDEADTGPGYTCYGGIGVSDSRFILGWAPGGAAAKFPADTGVRLQAGRKAVIQVHYNLLNGAHPALTQIDLTLADQVAYPATVSLFFNKQLEIPPGQQSVLAQSEKQNPANGPMRVWGNYPHMHELGTAIKVSAQRGAEDTCLIDIPRWDFNWQMMYFYQEPLTIEADDMLKLSCEYNSVGKTTTTTWGDGTQDEMCLNIFYATQ